MKRTSSERVIGAEKSINQGVSKARHVGQARPYSSRAGRQLTLKGCIMSSAARVAPRNKGK